MKVTLILRPPLWASPFRMGCWRTDVPSLTLTACALPLPDEGRTQQFVTADGEKKLPLQFWAAVWAPLPCPPPVSELCWSLPRSNDCARCPARCLWNGSEASGGLSAAVKGIKGRVKRGLHAPSSSEVLMDTWKPFSFCMVRARSPPTVNGWP